LPREQSRRDNVKAQKVLLRREQQQIFDDPARAQV
jgi:hypothetical protein